MPSTGRILLGRVYQGDLLLCEQSVSGARPDGGPAALVLGKVALSFGSILFVVGVPRVLAPGARTLALRISYFPRLHPPTTGDALPGVVSTIPISATPLPLESCWSRGHRINHPDFLAGLLVSAVSTRPPQLTLSQPVIRGAQSKAQLADALTYGVATEDL